ARCDFLSLNHWVFAFLDECYFAQSSRWLMERTVMKHKTLETILYSAAGVVAMALILIAFNVISGAFKERLDLTKEKAYTLSPGTRAILRKVDTTIKVRLYCTQSENATPETLYLKNYAKRVEDLLAEYK